MRAAPWTLRGILDALYAAVAEAGGGRLGGDKSPNDLKYLRALLAVDLFGEDLPVIHVVRDIRDVLVSFLDLGWAEGLPEGMVRLWSANNLMVRGTVPRRGSPYLLVRYEDLVADPEEEFRTMCEFLGVDFVPEMLDDERRYEQFAGHREIGQHARTFQPITADRVGHFRTQLDPDDRRPRRIAWPRTACRRSATSSPLVLAPDLGVRGPDQAPERKCCSSLPPRRRGRGCPR